jgi:hypothetical protein
MNYNVEITSGVILLIRCLIMIGSGIQLMLKLLPQQLDRLQYRYYRLEGTSEVRR